MISRSRPRPRPFVVDEELAAVISSIPRAQHIVRRRVKDNVRRMLRRFADQIRCQRRAKKDPPCHCCDMCGVRLDLRGEIPQLINGRWVAVTGPADRRPI